ncbi:hypothetical protein ACFVJ5_22010 [Nocardia sp. NPDC127606]|uniref:hypothetical protein n=1 Tax=Nocardia sp. NPDC127606 TaxID=3345406 RepID=UPI00363F284B
MSNENSGSLGGLNIPVSFFRSHRIPKPWEISPELDPRYMARVSVDGSNKLTDLRADYGSRKNVKLTSGARGFLGDAFTREFDARTGAAYFGGGERARIPVPNDTGTPFKPDGVVGKDKHIFLNENKFNTATWRPRQLLGYARYGMGNLGLNTSLSPDLALNVNRALSTGGLNSDTVAGVRVFRWNTQIVPTEKLLRGAAANFDDYIGPAVDKRGRVRKSAAQAKAWLDGQVSDLDNPEKQLNTGASGPSVRSNPRFGPGTPHRDQLARRTPSSAHTRVASGASNAAKAIGNIPGRLQNSGFSKSVGAIAAKASNSSIGGAASKVMNSTAGKVGGRLLAPVTTAFAINSDIKKGDSVAKSVTKNGVGLGASIAAGAAVGTLIPVPVVGTLAGAAVGAAVGLGATKLVDKAWDPAAKGVGKAVKAGGQAKKWLASKFADGGPVLGAGSSIGDMIPAFLSNGEYVVNAASAGRFKPLLESINKGVPGFAPTGMNPAMSSVLEKASSGFGDAANAFVSGQSGDVMKTFGLKDTPAAMKAGTQAAELLKSVGPQLGSLAGSAAKQVIPAKALVASAMAKGGAVDQSMTINLQTPDLDTAFQKSKTLEAQRALTYSGRW